MAYKLGWFLLACSSGLIAAAFNRPGIPSSPPETKQVSPGGRFSRLESIDIDDPVVLGFANRVGNTLEVTAGGRDIWGTSDEFHFSYQRQTGDFDVVVQVLSLTASHLYTKAGLMAREALSPGSPHVFLLVFPDNRPRHSNTSAFEFQYRDKQGAESKAIYPPQAQDRPAFPVEFPHAWLRLRRAGNQFTGLVSTDGGNWKVYTTQSMDLPATVFLGLAVTSHLQDMSTTAKFKDFGSAKETTK